MNNAAEVTLTNSGTDEKTYKSYFYYITAAVNVSTFNGTAKIQVEAKEERVTVPKATMSLTYTGNSLWNAVLSGSNMETAHITANDVSLSGITYDDKKGGASQELGTDTSKIKDVGEYKIKFETANGYRWTDGSACGDIKTITLTVGKAQPTVDAKLDTTGNIYITQGLPVNDDGTAKVSNAAVGGTPGKFTWGTGQTLKVGTFDYNCLFTPDDTDNYDTKDCSVPVKFIADNVTGIEATINENGSGEDKLYTSYSLETLGDEPWNLSVKLVYKSGLKVETSDYTLKVLKDGSLQDSFHADTNTVKVESNEYDLDCEFTVEVIQAEIDSIKSVDFSQGTNKIYPNTPLDNIEKYFTIKAGWNYNTGASLTLTPNDFKLVGTLVPGTGTSQLSIVYTKGGSEETYPVPVGALNKITVDYLTYNMNGVGFTGDLNPVYNGDPHGLTLTDNLPDGVTATITYEKDGVSSTTAPTDAGTYTVTASFTGDTTNYNAIDNITKTLIIKQAKVTGITFASEVKPEITDTTYTLEATGFPSWVTVVYSVEGKEGTSFSAAGTYKFTATFTHSDDNYEQIAPMTATLTISDKPPVEGADDIVVEPAISATYTGSPVDYKAQNVPSGVSVSYEILKDGNHFDGEEITDVGVYTVTVKFETGTAYAPIADKPCIVTVEQADYPDADKITFEGTTVSVGKTASAVAENVPDGVTVTYVYKGNEQSEPFEFTELNEDGYTVTVKFTHTNPNYKNIGEKTAVVKITAAVIESISATPEVTVYTTANGLDDLKAKLKVTAIYNNGTTAEIEDYELTCDGLRDNGKFKYGDQSLTVKYGDFTAVINNITVNRVKVALPTFKGGLSYTGVEVKPKAADFNGYDETLMTFVLDKTVSGLTVGSYKAVFALNDPENYEWATSTTMKKAVFALTYDEVVLNANEAAVDWNISKATLTASKSDGGLPVFASESFIGAFSDVVTLKYYRDEACTEEVEADKLAYETQYYVKAELLDTANFELDSSAAQYTVKSFTYTTPAKELTVWDKIVKFVVTNWLWLVIAVVALFLLILIIALAARSAKRKREREERRLAEEKAERERKEEREEQRRREDREERMARMSQQQATPAPQYIPQPMPQQYMPQMPQSAQPMATGGGTVSEAQFLQMQAEFKAEISALKAEQAAKEMAALRAEVAMRDDISILRSDGGRSQISTALNAETLAEIVTAAVKSALGAQSAEGAKSESKKEEGAVAQVPPDAVMTTVTTTKIDTTKKSAQTAQTQAQSTRPIVRNYVAPMPVDDGRVFDVGGFYTPADPVDLAFDEEEKKD